MIILIKINLQTVYPGDNSRLEPPDPIPNSAVKRTYADDSVGFPHVKVGHRQVFILKKRRKSLFFRKNSAGSKKSEVYGFFSN